MCKIITPVITVFDKDENIDYEGNKKVIDFLLDNNVDGILVLGSSGEFTNLTYEQKLDFFKFYSEYVDGRCELYAGTNCNKYTDIIKLSNECIKLGYVGAMVIGPYYFALDDEKIFKFYDTLAKNINGDLYIYNFPARSGHSISPETLKQLLKENDNIKGLKDSVQEPTHTNRILRGIDRDKFSVYSGFDDQFLYNISTGGRGCIGALSNIVPDIWSDLVDATNKKDFDKIIKLSNLIHELMPLYDIDSNFSLLFKKLMIDRGVEIEDTAIFPFNQMSKDKYEKAKDILKEVLEKYNAIK